MYTHTASLRLKALDPMRYGENDDYDTLVVFIYADGQPIVDLNAGGYATDWGQLIQSIHGSGEFEIFTCTCGYAGCAGIWEGVQVRQVGPNVIWHVTQPGEPLFTSLTASNCGRQRKNVYNEDAGMLRVVQGGHHTLLSLCQNGVLPRTLP